MARTTTERFTLLPPDDPWTAPPELGVSKPRRMKWTGAGVALVVFACLIVFVGLMIVAAVYDTARRTQLLHLAAEQVDGTVTRAWTESGTPMIAYAFLVGGRTVQGEHDIPRRLQQALGVGSHTRISYVPSEPEINRPTVSPDWFLPYWFSFLVFAFWLFMSGLAVVPLRTERRLLRFGDVARGVITNNPQGRRPKYGYVVKYEFQLPGGETVAGRTQRDRQFQTGQVVSIVYDPARPRRNDIYPLKVSRIRQ